MGWIVALVALAVLIPLNKRYKGKQKNKQVKTGVTLFILATAFTVGCGFAFTIIGRWFAAALMWVFEVFPAEATAALPVAVTVLVLLSASADVLYDRKADKTALGCFIVLPILLYLVVGGSLGVQGGDIVQQVNVQVAQWVRTTGGA